MSEKPRDDIATKIMAVMVRLPPEPHKAAPKPMTAKGRSAAASARERAPSAYRSHLRRLGERAFIRPSVHQAFAHSAFDNHIHALFVLNAKFRAVRITEVELSKVAVQMLFAAMLRSPFAPNSLTYF